MAIRRSTLLTHFNLLNVHPQFGPIGVFDQGANDGILDLAAMQVHTDPLTWYMMTANS